MIASNSIKGTKNNYSLAIAFGKSIISKSISFVSIFDYLFNETSVILASPNRCPTLIVDLITNYCKSVSNVNHVVCLKLTTILVYSIGQQYKQHVLNVICSL